MAADDHGHEAHGDGADRHGSHDHGGRDHGGHGHGHHHDRGWRGTLRYLKLFPKMWQNAASAYTVAVADPAPGNRCLDIGAGMGPGVVDAASRGADVIAVDPTPFMRRVLRLRRALSRHRKAITVIDGSAEHLGVGDASIDRAWAVNSVHHWQDLDAAAAEIARVLKPGGRVVLVDEDFDHDDHERNQDPKRRHRHRMDPVGAHQMADALRGAGLSDIEAVDTVAADGVPVKRATATKP